MRTWRTICIDPVRVDVPLKSKFVVIPDSIRDPERTVITGCRIKPGMSKLVYLIAGLIVLPAMVALAGCNDKGKDTKAAVSESAVSEKETQKKPKYDFPDEIYGDPKIWSEPRIQFVWQHPDDKYDSIWSMKTDGTDVRRAAGPELLSIDAGERYDLNTRPVRSPDNRYLAVVVTNFGRYDLAQYMIIDLKNKSKKAFMLDAAPPNFNWTQDSRYLYFYDRRRFLKYDAKTQSFEVVPKIYAKALYLIDNDRTFLGLQSRSLEFYDRQGRLVRKVGLPIVGSIKNRGHRLSPDGKKLKISSDKGRCHYIIDMADDFNVVFFSKWDQYNLTMCTFLPNENKLFGYLNSDNKMCVFDYSEKKLIELEDIDNSLSYGYMTTINKNPQKNH